MQTDPQPFLFLYSNGKKKLFWKHCFSGNVWWWWAEPKVWEVFCAHSLDGVSVFHHLLWKQLLKCWAVLRNQGQADYSTSEFCRLCHHELKEGSRHCTKCAGLQSLASQVLFSIWERVWGTLPSFCFYLGILGELLLKSLEAKWHFNLNST